ncbi:MAG: STAS domain-containing protein [Chloroflexota bacterium]
MNISVDPSVSTEIVYISGALTSHSHAVVDRTYRMLPGDGSITTIDVSGITDVTGAGIRALIRLYRILCDNNHNVRLCGGSAELMETLYLTGFEESLHIN